ncbi:MAG: polysaccharide pyruvyl transferase family protein [Pseudomonadota bacterium]
MTLRLFWANGSPNFGDFLSRDVVAWVSGREVTWAPISGCEMIAVGSIYPWLRRSLRRRLRTVHVWGSGTLDIKPGMRADARLAIAALRGPITAAMAGVDDVTLGDPGLLTACVWPDAADETGDRPGLVLHYVHMAALNDRQRDRLDTLFDLIDVRSEDAESVCRRIARCPIVFSSSLHGLVVADSYARPNVLVTPISATPRGFLKYHDYALSIGRLIDTHRVDLATLIDSGLPTGLPESLPYRDRIEETKAALIASFPAALKG